MEEIGRKEVSYMLENSMEERNKERQKRRNGRRNIDGRGKIDCRKKGGRGEKQCWREEGRRMKFKYLREYQARSGRRKNRIRKRHNFKKGMKKTKEIERWTKQ